MTSGRVAATQQPRQRSACIHALLCLLAQHFCHDVASGCTHFMNNDWHNPIVGGGSNHCRNGMLAQSERPVKQRLVATAEKGLRLVVVVVVVLVCSSSSVHGIHPVTDRTCDGIYHHARSGLRGRIAHAGNGCLVACLHVPAKPVRVSLQHRSCNGSRLLLP